MAKPMIIAHFETDEQGNPIFIQDRNKKHYSVTIEVKDSPQDAYAATFELYEDYYDPVQTLRPNKQGQFTLKTTSYGDYDVKVRVRTKEGDIPIADTLASALRRGSVDAPDNPLIQQALIDIAGN